MPKSKLDPKLRDAMREMLYGRRWTHFATLMANQPYMSINRFNFLLRKWDARMNRSIVGPKWLRRPDERINWFAFPEKLRSNPQWHLCLEILPNQVKMLDDRERGTDGLTTTTRRCWRAVAPAGTVDVQPIASAGAIDYATKHLCEAENFANYSTSLMFIRN